MLEKYTNIIKKAVVKNQPIKLSDTVGLAKAVDHSSPIFYTQKDENGTVSKWYVISGRQLRIKMIGLKVVKTSIHDLAKVSPQDANIVKVSFDNLAQLIKDVKYEDLDKYSFKDAVEKNDARIILSLKKVAPKMTNDSGMPDTDFLAQVLNAVSSSKIPFNHLFKFPEKPSMKRLIDGFDYVADKSKGKDEVKEPDYE